MQEIAARRPDCREKVSEAVPDNNHIPRSAHSMDHLPLPFKKRRRSRTGIAAELKSDRQTLDLFPLLSIHPEHRAAKKSKPFDLNISSSDFSLSLCSHPRKDPFNYVISATVREGRSNNKGAGLNDLGSLLSLSVDAKLDISQLVSQEKPKKRQQSNKTRRLTQKLEPRNTQAGRKGPSMQRSIGNGTTERCGPTPKERAAPSAFCNGNFQEHQEPSVDKVSAKPMADPGKTMADAGKPMGSNGWQRGKEKTQLLGEKSIAAPRPPPGTHCEAKANGVAAGRVDSKHVLFEKELTKSDTNGQDRLLIHKMYKDCFEVPDPRTNGEIKLVIADEEDGSKMVFVYVFWESSQSYVLKSGWSHYRRKKNLEERDTVTISRDENRQLWIGLRRKFPNNNNNNNHHQ